MHTTTLAGGTIEYQDIGTGPPVVLLHGVHMNETLWSRVVDQLSTDHRCIVPVLPLGGHRIPMPAHANQSAHGIADLVADFLAELDLDDVTLVGNDTGGALAQLLVTDQPDRIGRLVLTSCDAFDNWPPGLPGAASALAARLPGGLVVTGQIMRLPALARLPFTWGWMAKRPIPRHILDSWFTPLRQRRGIRRDVAGFLRSLDKQDLLTAAENLSTFDRPTLLAWAADDKVMPRTHADRLATCLPAADITEITDSYTLIPLDQPERLATLLRDFTHDRV